MPKNNTKGINDSLKKKKSREMVQRNQVNTPGGCKEQLSHNIWKTGELSMRP